MLVPLSWLKEYISISLDPKILGEKLTEMGLGCEKIHKTKNDVIFELEITPNRPDWLSIIGIAREIAAIEHKKIVYPEFKTNLNPERKSKILPLKIIPNFAITPRLTGIIIDNVTVKDSPKWLQEKLASIGMRSINNIVDITNFVMLELGNPIHSFDYHKIAGHTFTVTQARGGEKFESVDEITYKLPEGAIIFKDAEKIFDLVGIKGGKNSGTFADTKAIFIAVEVDDSTLIRKASQALGLRSEASAIFERAVNTGGTVDALKRTTDLILEIAGGNIASALIDIKKDLFKPWKLNLRLDRLMFVLGIQIPGKTVVEYLERLNLSPVILNEKKNPPIIQCTIPTYRNDLKIEEDLIEEVARMHGYNNFPKTMITGETPSKKVPYFRDYRLFESVKRYFAGCGFSEIYSYSLVSESDLSDIGISSEKSLRVDNPISREFEYLRSTLKGNLLKALKQNSYKITSVQLFEFGKVYVGSSLDNDRETYMLSGISNSTDYLSIKGILERLFQDLGVKDDASQYIEILDVCIFFEIDFLTLLAKQKKHKVFAPIPKFPNTSEDITIKMSQNINAGDIISEIKKQSNLIAEISLVDSYGSTKTFHIIYQSTQRTLTSDDCAKVRKKIITAVEEKFGAEVK